jgi:hypothetical protein
LTSLALGLIGWLLTLLPILVVSLRAVLRRRKTRHRLLAGVGLLSFLVFLAPLASALTTERLDLDWDAVFALPMAVNIVLLLATRFDPVTVFSGEEPRTESWLARTVARLDRQAMRFFVLELFGWGLLLFFLTLGIQELLVTEA